MNAGEILFGHSVTTSTATPVSADRTTDLYAAWKSVLERIHVSEHAPRDVVPTSHPSRVDFTPQPAAASSEIAPREVAAMSMSVPDGAREAQRETTTAALKRPASAELNGVDVRPSRLDTTQSPLASSAAARGVSAAANRIDKISSDPTRVDRAPVLTEESNESAEAVNVFVNGGTVAIVLRDTKIASDVALASAFAAAGELTGQRGALERLTLNGRVLYRQPPGEARDSFPANTVDFLG